MAANAATRIRSEFGLETAQVVLGHAKADVTQIYAERDQAKAVTQNSWPSVIF